MGVYGGFKENMKNLNGLLTFCKNYSAIICYGASDHGHTVKHFLEKKGIKVLFFLISDEVAKGEVRDGIPVHSIAECRELKQSYGIVLSLYDRHHKSVKENLKKYSNRTDGIYSLSAEELKLLRSNLISINRINVLSEPIYVENDEIDSYKRQIEEIKSKYDKVEFCYIEARRMGAFSLWMYYSYQRKSLQSNCFYVYYPVTHEHRNDERLRGSNGYLLTKLSGHGIEVISKKNINFWRYFFQTNKKYCLLSEKYTEWGWNKELCSINGKIDLSQKYIKFDEKESLQGNDQLGKMGLNNDFVCISSRDSAYLQGLKRDEIKKDFRDVYRNSDIQAQFLAVDYLVNKNIRSVRMGAVVEEKINNSKIIDYASNYRTEFMDTYITSKCKFFVSDLSGIQVLAMLFSKPMVILNAPLLTTKGDLVPFFSPNKDIAIFKKMWNSTKMRYLTIREMLAYEVDGPCYEENIQGNVFRLYQENGIVPEDNTSVEILEVVKEMNERIDGTRKYDELDKNLQAKYRSIVDDYPKKDNFLNYWRIGAEFLRKNQWLLD